MRIVIKNNGPLMKTSVNDMLKGLGVKAIESTGNKVASTFKAVKSRIYEMDGGVGSLQTAVDQIDERVSKIEEKKVEKVGTAVQSLGAFLHNAIRTDQTVSRTVALQNEKFYQANPWAIPPAPPRKKKWYEKLYDALKAAGKAIKNAVTKARLTGLSIPRRRRGRRQRISSRSTGRRSSKYLSESSSSRDLRLCLSLREERRLLCSRLRQRRH